jgi:plastocyanin
VVAPERIVAVRSTRAPLALLLGAILLGLCASACAPANIPYQASGSPSIRAQPAATVYLNAGSFTPPAVHIQAGQTVEWVWLNHGVPHNVTFGTFHSPTQVSGTWSHTFTESGTHLYLSTLDYRMVGTVVVT